MTPDPAIDDAQLAAYLAGDLDEVTARRIDARLAADAALGARLDRVHDVLVGLTRPDATSPPPGLADRVRAHVAEEVRPSAPARPRRSVNAWVGGVAAGLVAVALVGGTVLIGLPGGDDEAADMTRDEVATVESAEESAPENDLDVSDDSDDDAGDLSAELMERGPAADEDVGVLPGGPDVAEEGDGGAAGQGPDQRSERILAGEAEEVADRRWEELADGQAACRGSVEEAVGTPAVPLSTFEDGRGEDDVVVFELATLRAADDEFLDGRARVVVRARTCEVLDVTRR
jgi:hypothetical protein